MANSFDGSVYNLDTTGVITTEARKVKAVEWQGTGLTAGTTQVVIRDPVTLKELFHSRATGTTVVEYRLIEDWWWNGFELVTLGGGALIVSLL
jgi:hypothetical protein